MNQADEDFAEYVTALENTILIAAEALRTGDLDKARTVIEIREKAVRASLASMEAELAGPPH